MDPDPDRSIRTDWSWELLLIREIMCKLTQWLVEATVVHILHAARGGIGPATAVGPSGRHAVCKLTQRLVVIVTLRRVVIDVRYS